MANKIKPTDAQVTEWRAKFLKALNINVGPSEKNLATIGLSTEFNGYLRAKTEQLNSPEHKLAKFGASTAMVNMSGVIPSWEAINDDALRHGIMVAPNDIEDCVYAPKIEQAIKELLA